MSPVPAPPAAVAAPPLWRTGAFWAWHLAAWLALAVATWLQRTTVGAPATPAALLGIVRWAAIGAAVSAGLAVVHGALPDPRRAPARVAWRVGLGALLGAGVWDLAHAVRGYAPDVGAAGIARSVLVHAVLLLLWSAALVAVLVVRAADARARAARDAERMAAEARHRMLVYQVNPHFLFNALNSVRALVEEEPRRARAMITRLAEVLRAALDADPLRPTTLGAELDTIAAYLAVEQVRFEERLAVTLEATPAARGAAVPGFLLQPLVENAITHGRGAPLRVAVRAWCTDGAVHVTVSNTGRLAPPSPTARDAGRGIGLANVRERLALLHGDAASCTLHEADGMVHAQLVLPYAAPASGAAPPGVAAPASGRVASGADVEAVRA